MEKLKRQAPYLSYLLRLWCEEDAGKPVWRVSLESVQTRERQGFASLPTLYAYLMQQIVSMPTKESEVMSQPLDDNG